MSWSPFGDFYYGDDAFDRSDSSMQQLAVVEKCFIRKGHRCDKMLGASKSCFIACPADDELDPMLELIGEKLARAGIEAVVAVKDRAYGQDIFCTKICGKIIESQFCIVILDETVRDGHQVSNPNVYYEYGLMTALGKHIVPLQKDGMALAFNIRSFDTVIYTPKNMGLELDAAIKDAIRAPEAANEAKSEQHLSDRTILRRLELQGLIPPSEGFFLRPTFEDTLFRGFVGRSAPFYPYLLLARIDDDAEIAAHLEDLQVIEYRMNREREVWAADAEQAKSQQSDLQTRIRFEVANDEDDGSEETERARRVVPALQRHLYDLRETSTRLDGQLESTAKIYAGFVLPPSVDQAAFLDQVNAVLATDLIVPTVCSEGRLKFGEYCVDLGSERPS